MEVIREPDISGNYELSVSQKSNGKRGKENFQNPFECHLQDKEKLAVGDIKLTDSQKSKLPVLAKTKAPPDFQKMHQAWQNQFQKGKALSKKSCTRPQPFNLSQKGDRFRVTAISDIGQSATLSNTNQCQNQLTGCANREPLIEVCFGQKSLRKNITHSKDPSEDEFKADPAALASILSNAGVSNVAGGIMGKLSLAQRVPVKISATSSVSNAKGMMVRSSLYTMRSSQAKCTNLERMSCFSRLTTKGEKQRAPFRPEQASQQFDNILKCLTSKDDCILQSQVNPVLQQMNQPLHVPVTSKPPQPVTQSDVSTKPQLSPDQSNVVNRKFESSTTMCQDTGEILPVVESALVKDTHDKPISDPGFGEFVADSQALASILSNTGVTVNNDGKLSLAQRVPVQENLLSMKNGMVSLGSVVGKEKTPKPAFGRMSNVPLKDAKFSPCRVLNSNQTPSTSPWGSARRIHKVKSSTMTFSQAFSFNVRQPVFPKTPKALAVEMANKRFEAEFPEPQALMTKSSVKWADQPSPASVPDSLFEKESSLEQVAVRLFPDADCTGDADKKEIPINVLDCAVSSVPCTKDEVVPEKSTAADGTAADDRQIKQLHQELAPLSIQEPRSTLLTARSPSIELKLGTSLPLTFLSHPAVQALKFNNYGPRSLPHIAQMRLQETMSAKKRFWDTCLDDECAFYTSFGGSGSSRSCDDPVASSLEKQENMHFIPISPGEPGFVMNSPV
ncbi:Hypothetical predicted protein [Pelobates cultripes]|uniref:Uncharacterized protein n=2 Tax=Pelobates cultripes TaxID=61616 RepID=A0AAD1R694_PELCU|nr:Hypothetical predicted protein [Pelobates cultripes]